MLTLEDAKRNAIKRSLAISIGAIALLTIVWASAIWSPDYKVLAAQEPLAPDSCAALFSKGRPKSQWVFYGSNGKLSYKKLPSGDRIMDYSQAGYMGGGVAIPNVAVQVTVSPSGGDDTAAIQSAIDAVSSKALVN